MFNNVINRLNRFEVYATHKIFSRIFGNDGDNLWHRFAGQNKNSVQFFLLIGLPSTKLIDSLPGDIYKGFLIYLTLYIMKKPEKLDAKYWHGTFLQRVWDDDVKLYTDQLEAERKEANQFIIQIAELLGIDADGIGFDGLTLSIDDFKEAINKLKQ